MKTLIINGSPNGKRGNSEIICKRFMMGMKIQPDVRYIVEEDPVALATVMENYDCWLFFFPMYVNAMPGIVKRLFEYLKPSESKNVGYFVQYGFAEAFQSDWLCATLKNYNRRMGYNNIGIVAAGDMAGLRFMPERMNKKIFTQLEKAGELFEQIGRFDEDIIRYFGRLHRYSEKQIKNNERLRKLGLTQLIWNFMLRKNNAYKKRLDKPFMEQV